MTNMAATPICGKNTLKIFFRTNRPMTLKLGMQHCEASTAKIVQIMTWSHLDSFDAKVKFGHLGCCIEKSEKYFDFKTNYFLLE